jgi:NitT/TauT family transport system substrate-binding protein
MVHLYENLRTVSYAPFYIAETLKLFETHGVEVEMSLSASTEETALGLLEGRMDVAFGGPMRVMLHHDQDPMCPLVCFCQVVGPEPFMLIGNTPRPDFYLRQLPMHRLAVVSEVPTPWLLLQDDLQRVGVDPASLQRTAPATMEENVAALARGDVDVIQVMEPEAELALSAGAHLWHACCVRGSVGFTTFYARRDYLDANTEACKRLSTAVMAATEHLYEAPPEASATLIQERFPHIEQQHLANSIERYQRHRIWTTQSALAASEFVRLKAALLAGGFISTDVPFANAVYNF